MTEIEVESKVQVQEIKLAPKNKPGRPRTKPKRYINVSRAKLHTGVEEITVNGVKWKTQGVLFPRDWEDDNPDPRQGAKVMELPPDIAKAFGDKVVAIS